MTRRRARHRQPVIVNLATHTAQFVTAPALAAYFDLDPRTIIRMIANGSLEGFKVGKQWRIPTDAAREAFPIREDRRRDAS